MTLSINASAVPTIKDGNPAGDTLLAALQDLVPTLRERALEAEATGRIPEATVTRLTEIGAFRAVVPERFGGLELPFPYVPQIFRILGRGCSSTSWCMGFLVYHNFQFAHFPLKAQEEGMGHARLLDGTRAGHA